MSYDNDILSRIKGTYFIHTRYMISLLNINYDCWNMKSLSRLHYKIISLFSHFLHEWILFFHALLLSLFKPHSSFPSHVFPAIFYHWLVLLLGNNDFVGIVPLRLFLDTWEMQYQVTACTESKHQSPQPEGIVVRAGGRVHRPWNEERECFISKWILSNSIFNEIWICNCTYKYKCI